MSASDAFHRAQSAGFAAPGGIVQQPHVRAPYLAVQHRREAVRRDMDHAPTARQRAANQALDFRAIGAVVPFDDARPQLPRRATRRRRPELRMPYRAIEVDHKAADGRGHERRRQRVGPEPSPSPAPRGRIRGGSRARSAAPRNSRRYGAGTRLPPCSQVTRKESIAWPSTSAARATAGRPDACPRSIGG